MKTTFVTMLIIALIANHCVITAWNWRLRSKNDDWQRIYDDVIARESEYMAAYDKELVIKDRTISNCENMVEIRNQRIAILKETCDILNQTILIYSNSIASENHFLQEFDWRIKKTNDWQPVVPGSTIDRYLKAMSTNNNYIPR